MQGKGFVISAKTYHERRAEIKKWAGDAWWPTLIRIDSRLERIDPKYELIQIKEKFGELCYYFSPSILDPEKTQEMRKIVQEGVKACWEADKQRRQFDKVAVPPTPWKFDF